MPPEHDLILQETALTFAEPFLAPEITTGLVTAKSDVFSIGILIWELMFTHANTRIHPSNITNNDVFVQKRCEFLNNCEMVVLICRCIDPNPAKRPSVGTLWQLIQVFLIESTPRPAFELKTRQASVEPELLEIDNPLPPNNITLMETGDDVENIKIIAKAKLIPMRLRLNNSNYTSLAMDLDNKRTVFVKRSRVIKAKVYNQC